MLEECGERRTLTSLLMGVYTGADTMEISTTWKTELLYDPVIAGHIIEETKVSEPGMLTHPCLLQHYLQKWRYRISLDTQQTNA